MFSKAVSNLKKPKSVSKAIVSAAERGEDNALHSRPSLVQTRGYRQAEKFTPSHHWIRVEKDVGTVGVTPQALKDMGDIAFVDLPKINQTVIKDQILASIEVSKTTLDLQTPVSGVILEVNQELANNPSLLSTHPTNQGWLFKIKMSSADELSTLLDANTYANYCK